MTRIGITVKIRKNVLSRFEIRWDHNASGDETFGGGTVPDKKNFWTVAANLIYKF